MITWRGLAVVLAGLSLPHFVSAQIAIDPTGNSVTVTKGQPQIRSARRAFTAIIPAVELKDQPLGKSMDRLRDAAGANILIDWKSLEAAGITKDSLVNVSLMEIPFGDALGLVMQAAGPKVPVLTYVDSNVIHITTRDAADKQLITRAYNVSDLTGADVSLLLPQGGSGLNNINNRNNNTTGTNGVNYVGNQTNNQGQQNGQQNQQQQNGQNGNQQQTTGQLILQAQKQAGADLVNLVKSTIRPDIWSDGKGGGGPANIVFYNNMLVVTAPIYVQEQIGGPVPGH